MAITKVTQEVLEQLATVLRQSADEILMAKENMDGLLYRMVWDDPTGLYFRSKYEEDFKPVTDKLIPNIMEYLEHLSGLGINIAEYGDLAGIAIAGGGLQNRGDRPFVGDPYRIGQDPNDFGKTEGQPGFFDEQFKNRIDKLSEEDLKYQESVYQEYLEKAQLANYAYHDGAPLPNGWLDEYNENPTIKNICDDIANNGGNEAGLKFSVLKSKKDERYIIAFSGTDFNEMKEAIKDGKTDFQGAFSHEERQSQLSQKLVRRLVLEGDIPLQSIEFTGHSLGGRLAAENSVDFLRPAITFNAAGSFPERYEQYERMAGITPGYRSTYQGVRNLATEHDILTNLQSGISGSTNPYIAAIPKEQISILHETVSKTGKASKVPLSLLGPQGKATQSVVEGLDKAFTIADGFNKYYNRDYRALGYTMTLPDGYDGISVEAHGIKTVENLLSKRLQIIRGRLEEIKQ